MYDPAAHAVHPPPFAPVKPILQVQSVCTLLPAAELEFAGQLVQVPDPVAPTAPEYVLAPHATQALSDAAPDVARYLPAPQLRQVEAPVVVEYVPAPQSTQELASVAPVVVRYLPAPQSTQELATVAPVVARYLPATQSVQTVSIADLYLPAGQSKHASLPTGELEPGGQAVQAAEPFASLYCDTWHAVHDPPLFPVKPGLQTQLVSAAAPAVDVVFSGQA